MNKCPQCGKNLAHAANAIEHDGKTYCSPACKSTAVPTAWEKIKRRNSQSINPARIVGMVILILGGMGIFGALLRSGDTTEPQVSPVSLVLVFIGIVLCLLGKNRN